MTHTLINLSDTQSLLTSDLITCFTPIKWEGNQLRLIDQRLLPSEETEVCCSSWREVADAIRAMVVRGAPAIGITAAYGLVLAAQEFDQDLEIHELILSLERAARGLSETRPTAVNLFWAIEEMSTVWRKAPSTQSLARQLEERAVQIHLDDIATCQAMGDAGAALLNDGARILTHCNTGALATGGYGTALGVIRSAHAQGKLAQVYADETRPFWQGSRLTAWELHREKIPVRVICDSMAGYLMQRGQIDAIFVGADRIAANGDTANKIGTYPLSIIANAHSIPFYVVAPTSTVDLNTLTGEEIPIERRPDREVTHCGDHRVVPEGVEVENPAFDVTPAKLITGIVTERGVILRDNFLDGLKNQLGDKHSPPNIF